jgi:uncharacterized protein GlcG (DUF336 family)
MSASSQKASLGRRSVVLGLSAVLLTATGVALTSCNAKVTSQPVGFVTQGPALPLTAFDVDLIIRRAVASIDSPNMHVAVTARTGDILGVYSTIVGGGQGNDDAANIAVGLARTTSFFSNSQAPLSSRTVETLGAFHFPPTFASEFIASQLPISAGAGADATSVIPPRRRISGVAGTPPAPLWQINSTNRGAWIADPTPSFPTAENTTVPPTFFNRGLDITASPDPDPDSLVGNRFFLPSRSIAAANADFAAGFFTGDPNFDPTAGIVLLPGAVPLFKANANGVLRLVGGIGVYVLDSTGGPQPQPNVEEAEFAAIQGASSTGAGDPSFFFDGIPFDGQITIVGITLPYVKQTTRPENRNPSFFPRVGGGFRTNFGSFGTRDGRADPFGYLIGPRPAVTPIPTSDTVGGLNENNVRTIINQVVASSDLTRAQVRLPLGSSARVIATIVDNRGLILAHFRMEDTLCDAIDVVPAKARSTVYYCQPGGPFATATTNGVLPFPFGDQWSGFPTDPTGQNRGIALTTRTLGFLSQPFYPPGIGGTFSQADYIADLPNFTPAPGNTAPGPLYNLALLNQLPTQVDRWGNALADPGYQNGLTFFPGSVPLYKEDVNGVMQLVGALGVSGDGVEQNDLIAFEGGRGFEPPPELRIDNFEFDGVKLPYLKFPETPR